MRKIIIRPVFLLVSMIIFFITSGCVKETYNMKMFSSKLHLAPTLAISAVKGDISFGDIVKSSDTVVFDPTKFVKIVFKETSVIDLKLTDFYSFGNMVSFSKSYPLGDLSIAPFQKTMGYTLSNILALNNGLPHPFPPFGTLNLGEQSFSFTNFENAVFKSGFLDISIKNNLNATLNNITLNLYNAIGRTTIAIGVIIPSIPAGQTGTASINLADKAVTNSILAGIILSGSPGNATPVLINASNSNIQVTIEGRDLKVKSGRAILPANTITSLTVGETIKFDPGTGVEVNEFKITSGNLSYHIQKPVALAALLTYSIPTAKRNGSTPISELINLGTSSVCDGNISFSNTIVNLGSDPVQPFNSMPYSISVSSSGMVNFNSTDVIKIDLKLLNPVFDYLKGYFGQKTSTIKPYSFNLGIEDVLNKLTGTFLISNPSLKLNYSNSFGIPVEVTLNVIGKRKTQTVDLGLKPFQIAYPKSITIRNADSSLAINKSNSLISNLVSLPSSEINFSGSAKMNPLGATTGRNNYVFGNSGFLGSVEVEVPLEFKINNLQFADTLDNFMKDDSGNSPVKPENFELLLVNIIAKNGFPFGISIKMSLYDSKTRTVKSTVDATGLLAPAPVDSNGKANGITETSTSIEFTKAFFSSISNTDKIIFQFTLNTKDNSTIKIYSDYRIDFNAALVLKPNINFN